VRWQTDAVGDPRQARVPNDKEMKMNKTPLTLIAMTVGLAFGSVAMAGNMSKSEYTAAKKDIEAEYKSAVKGCEPLVAHAKDACMVQAKSKQSLAQADLAATYKPSAQTRYDARIAKAKGDDAIAKDKCQSLAGNDKDVCLKQADAALVSATADAKTQMKTSEANKTAGEKVSKARVKAGKQVAEAHKDAAADKRDAEYSVAKEKCDALTGTPRDTCLGEAKAHYGKS
jgi:hypothetical protein